MKTLLWSLLCLQAVLIAFSIGLILIGQGTVVSWFNIILNLIFGYMNLDTLHGVYRREK